MLLLGLTGPIGHGKTTFAKALASIEPLTIHLESSLVVASVANSMHMVLTKVPDPYDIDAINEWLKQLPPILDEKVRIKTTFERIQLTQEQVEQHPIEYQKLIMHIENLRRNPHMARQAITIDNKENYRPFLQWLGGYLVQKIDAGVWYNQMVRLVKDAESTGCKLCLVGGLRYPTDAAILRGAGGIIVKLYRPGHLQNDILDPTERERNNIAPDTTIISNGTVDDVRRIAVEFYKDLQANNVQSTYTTN
jgi:energy-coupling factor transporter ATP-binding protein EcfA2